MISEKQYFDSAMLLNVEVAAIKAVKLVESRGAGFLPNGVDPVILFEPHVFWQQLMERDINPMDHLTKEVGKKRIPNPEYQDILYPKWQPGKYGPVNAQHERLKRAANIHREAALASASWGTFQVMGFNYEACDCKTLQEFINAMYKNEDEHLRLFVNFLKTKGLDKHLRSKNWDAFALGYNGKGYKVHNYHGRLADAYKICREIQLKSIKK